MVDHSAVGRKSKRKGSSFELTTAKNLTKWWGHEFHRVPASGGLHWKGSNNVSGDIVAPLEANFPFVVECKKREEWTLENLFLNNKDIKNWWGQVVGDALETNKVPMLVFTRNRAKTFVTLPYNEAMVYWLVEHDFQVMTSNITYVDPYKDSHTYHVLTTILEGVTSLAPAEIRDFYTVAYDWQEVSLVKETKKIENALNVDAEESLQQLIDQVD